MIKRLIYGLLATIVVLIALFIASCKTPQPTPQYITQIRTDTVVTVTTVIDTVTNTVLVSNTIRDTVLRGDTFYIVEKAKCPPTKTITKVIDKTASVVIENTAKLDVATTIFAVKERGYLARIDSLKAINSQLQSDVEQGSEENSNNRRDVLRLYGLLAVVLVFAALIFYPKK